MKSPAGALGSESTPSHDGWSPLPIRARLEAMATCQLRCPSCPTTTGAIRPAIAAGQLTPALFKQFLDGAPGVKHIELSNYGEVLLNRALGDILEMAKARGVEVSIANGVNLNHLEEGMADTLVRTGVLSMKISIDGATQETYEKYRIHGDLARVLVNIDAINAAKKRYGSERPALFWQFVIFGHNEHEIRQARAMALDRGMTFKAKISWDDGVSPIRDEGMIRRETGLPPSRSRYREERGKPYLREICHQLWDDPQFNWNGDNLGCCRNFWGDFGGNAIRDGFEATFNHEKMRRGRRMLLGLEAPSADIPCANCDLYLEMRRSGRFLVRRDRGGPRA